MPRPTPRLLLAFAFALAAFRPAFAADPPSDNHGDAATAAEQAEADQIRGEVAAIRGLKFKQPIKVENQTIKDFTKYVETSLDKQIPDARLKSYGAVVKKLGLYRGPEIKDFRKLEILVATSQAAAYYDPDTKKFYILASQMADLMRQTVYAHELTHGLQDQNFDLNKYMIDAASGKLNDDEVLARQSVVEGEATYMMNLWQMKKMGAGEANSAMLKQVIRMQSQVDVSMIRQMIKQGGLSELGLDGLEDSVKAMDEIPNFILETMVGAYLKGMNFVFEVQQKGWDKVDKLFTTAPPASSEQILHPEKWFQGEKPFQIAWGKFEDCPALKGYALLDENTIGELQWRVIFSEFGMAAEGRAAAAGWDGDRYAVLQKEGVEDPLMIEVSCWDTADDATEFADAYLKLAKAKYPSGDEAVEVDSTGKEVYIIEGADWDSVEAIKTFMKSAKKMK